MTEKEAIKELKIRISPYNTCKADYESNMAINMAIKALEKQIPKEPYFEGDGYYDGNLVYDTWICPNCDSKYEVDFAEHEYCPHCGQAIKWE